jgi:hypothetical protein
MQKSTAGGSNFDDEREQGGPELVIGDADNVQKTTYVVGQGTDPGAADPDRGRGAGPDGPERGNPDNGYVATVRSGGGTNVGLWAVALLALLIAVVYGFGLFT